MSNPNPRSPGLQAIKQRASDLLLGVHVLEGLGSDQDFLGAFDAGSERKLCN
jgi:hypothetical protein